MDVTALIDWSRMQFAMTAAYHWLFVPLTLGLSMIMATMETLYLITKDEFWKKTAKFWMKIFGINFAVGIATGLILEFEFGTNWSNYSWFVGDIFGAPLAVEGIVAFFIEATFVAVMYFGWDKVNPKFHLASTWLTGIGAAISAYWILVANGWMQHPVGTAFNPDTVRNEMISFWAVASNPVAVSKFFHAVFSGWATGGVVAVGISCWYLLKGRELRFAKQSIIVSAIVGLIGLLATMFSGDIAGEHVAEFQPAKFAAIEKLDKGGRGAAFTVVPGVEVPKMLSLLATKDADAYIPGKQDILSGYVDNAGNEILAVEEKMSNGRMAIDALKNYRLLKDSAPEAAAEYKAVLDQTIAYLGYGYLNAPEDVFPNEDLLFWAFRLMIGFGMILFGVLCLSLWFAYKDKMGQMKWLLWLGILSIPLVYLAGQFGWIVAEVGRQPWAIQDLLPVNVAMSSLSVAAVKTTFFIFVAIFTLFLVIELRIMCKAIALGPQIDDPTPTKARKKNS